MDDRHEEGISTGSFTRQIKVKLPGLTANGKDHGKTVTAITQELKALKLVSICTIPVLNVQPTTIFAIKNWF